jgi:hypothetical protein
MIFCKSNGKGFLRNKWACEALDFNSLHAIYLRQTLPGTAHQT